MKHISQVWNWFKDIFASIRTKSGIHPLPQLKTNTNKEESTSLISSIGTMTVGQITLFRFIGVCVTYVGYLMFQSLQLLYLILAAVLVSVAMESLIMIGQKWMPR
jgi:hypothetical protein